MSVPAAFPDYIANSIAGSIARGMASGDSTLASLYSGQLATRAYGPTGGNANTQYSTRSYHYARDTMSTFQLVFPNFNSGGANFSEVGPGSVTTITASVEYPAATFTQVLFSASASGTIPNNGLLTSDAISLAIPNGAKFFVRTYQTNPSGVNWNNNIDLANGDASAWGTTGIVDQTMSGTISSNTSALYTPIAIIGQTRKATVSILGDSRAQGFGGAVAQWVNGDAGEIAANIGSSLGYINLGVSGHSALNFVASHTNKIAASVYCSHLVVQLGFNDTNAGFTPASIIANLNTIAGYKTASQKVFHTTKMASSTSTDLWATLVNQTTFANNPNCITLNTAIRAGLTNPAYLEIAWALESSHNSGLWAVNGTPNWTTFDGTHENATGYQLIGSSGAVTPAMFTR